jgi:predicted transcriptional regulator
MHHRPMARPVRARDKVDLQVRGVPSALRRRLGEKAARQGVSMSRFVITLLEANVDRPATIDDWLAELDAGRTGRTTGFSPSATLREVRDELDRP